MKIIALLAVLLVLSSLGSGCGKGWQIDYGEPEAQFLQEDVAAKGNAYVGKLITVKGIVAKVDVADPEEAWIHLTSGIRCNLGKFKAMAESCRVGETVYVGGFLKRCNEDDVLIEPALLRDPKAPFSPQP